MSTLIGNYKISREQLAALPTPAGTATHKPIPHHQVIEALVETLGFRGISVTRDEYAVAAGGNKMFGVLDLAHGFGNLADMSHSEAGRAVNFSIGIRNSHDKSMRLGMTVGYRVFVCENMAFNGDFEPVLAKHSKNFSLIDALSIGVDRMQRNFEPMIQQVRLWQEREIKPELAKMVIYQAFVEGKLDAPRNLAPVVHDTYFNPQSKHFHEEFAANTFWKLSNAFTSAFKELDPVPQFKATASLGSFLDSFCPKNKAN